MGGVVAELFKVQEKWICCEKVFVYHLQLVSQLKSPCPALGEDALIADQFEVSECTLPGPSVGDITEDGVVASCHPPLAYNTQIGKG